MADDLQYYTILTNKGLEYEAECISSENEFHITQIAVGDGNGAEITPSASQTQLVNEIKRYDVFNEDIDSSTGLYYATIQIPASDGGFTIRELGGYNKNGDLVMVAKFPPTEKRAQTTGDLRRTFIRMDLSIVNERTFPSIVDSSLSFPSTEYVNKKLNQLDTNLTENFTESIDTKISNILETIYPVGSIYIGVTSTCPISAVLGTWELVASDRVLQGASENHPAGTTIAAGLPNITGRPGVCARGGYSGAFYSVSGAAEVGNHNGSNHGRTMLSASRSSSVYGNSTTVQPPAYSVNIWQRVA